MSNSNYARIDEMLGDRPDAHLVTRDDGLTFAGWLYELDDICEEELGLGFLDLADFNSWDCWNDGSSPLDGFDVLCEAQDFDPREWLA